MMKKILVCEDEAAIRDFVVINLRRAGYDVVEADCGEMALEKYEEQGGDFDVAILDIMMPGIDGLQVCKELRNKNSGIGIIMLSARTQEMDKVTGLMLGADDYITKPFSPSELTARVDSLYRRVSLSEQKSENNFKEELQSGIFTLNLRNRALMKLGSHHGHFPELRHHPCQGMNARGFITVVIGQKNSHTTKIKKRGRTQKQVPPLKAKILKEDYFSSARYLMVRTI